MIFPSPCPNCGGPVEEAYCPRCGQARNERLSLRHILRRQLGDLTDFNGGFLYTAWRLTIAPARVIRDFIDGRRKPYVNPFKYSFILAAAFLAVFHLVGDDPNISDKLDHVNLKSEDAASQKQIEQALAYVRNVWSVLGEYLNVIMLLLIPIPSLATWRVFKDQRLNYAEHLTANAYIFAQLLLFFTLLQTVRALTPDDFFGEHLSRIYFTGSIGFYAGVLAILFRAVSWPRRLVRIAVSLLLTFMLFTVLVLGLVAAFVIGLLSVIGEI